MKKSILSLSAAIALGGLGLAGSAHAVVALGVTGTNVGGTPTARDLVIHPAGTGHMLIGPYFTTQGSMGSLFNITNTDTVNGKVVKVRFRGASGSDELLDFTVFLSPGDVWTGSLARNAAGRSELSTPDASCTLPEATAPNQWPGVFKTLRLPKLDDESKVNALTREGYFEVYNMADIPAQSKGPFGATPNPLYTAIKHVNAKAPCTAGVLDVLKSVQVLTTASDALAVGLDSPTGKLMGSWAVLNTEQIAVYGGEQTAILATSGRLGVNGVAPEGAGLINYSPQMTGDVPYNTVVSFTSDPLLTVPPNQFPNLGITAQWWDLPDLSTPYISGDYPQDQAERLSDALAKEFIMNDYVATAAGAGGVAWMTDWVVSQPTRRYHAAVLYDTLSPITNGSPVILPDFYGSMGAWGLINPESPYTGRLVLNRNAGGYGPMACLRPLLSIWDREETAQWTGGFSPGDGYACGEVFTLQFGTSSVLQAAVTAHSVTHPLPGVAGWAKLQMSQNTGTGSGSSTAIHPVPVVGFAATSIKAGNGNYGLTVPHRWTGAAVMPLDPEEP